MLDKLTDDQRSQLVMIVDNLLRSEKGNTELERGIQELNDSALSIELSFRTVRQSFLQAERDASPYQKDITPLRKDWDIYHKEYLRLLWLSRDVAGKARSAIDEFSNEFFAFLANPTQSIDDKKQEIRLIKDKIVDGENDALDLKNGFQALRDNVDKMRTRVTTLIENYGVEIGKLQFEQETLQKGVGETQTKLGRMYKWMTGSAALTVAIGLGLGAVAVAGAFCPVVWISALVGIGAVVAFGVVTLGGQTIYTFDLKDDEIKALDKLQKNENAKDDMEKINNILNPLPNEMENISSRLKALESVWLLLRTDLQTVENQLNNVMKTTPGRFKERLQTANTSCVALSRALYLYQTTLDTRGVPRVDISKP